MSIRGDILVQDVAQVGAGTMPGQVDRYNMKRMVSLTANVEGEDLERVARRIGGALQAVNESLWEIEDDIRRCEAAQDFGQRFIEVARSVYKVNDCRGQLKRRINELLGSRIIGGTALRGGMPLYKYVANRFLTAFENLFLGVKLSEYHTGYRAFSRKVLTELPLLENSDDFVFDNQILAQCVYFGFRIGEVSCPTKYFEEASSINFLRSVNYGLGVLATTMQFALQKSGFGRFRRFSPQGRRLDLGYYMRGAANRTPAA